MLKHLKKYFINIVWRYKLYLQKNFEKKTF